MKKDILFIGIGQGGSNIAYEMQQKGFTSCYINSTIGDIRDLDINRRFIYHIPGANGCARDRIKALEYTKEYFNTIDSWINTDFVVFENIYICFAMGGGTGSGISPALTSILAKKYPNKNFGIVAILPSSDESLIAKKNAIECFEQIKKISKELKNIIFLDNNSTREKKVINSLFADDFNRFISIPTLKNIEGNIDADEIQKLIGMKGNVVFGNIKNNVMQSTKIYPITQKDCKAAFIVNNAKDNTVFPEDILSNFGRPLEFFTSICEDVEPFAGVFALSLPTKRISEIIEEIQIDTEKIMEISQEVDEFNISDFKIPDILKDYTNNSKKHAKRTIDTNEVDLDKAFTDFLN
ncbi:MAG: hypothetical protein ACTTKD_09710 [Peptoanaerobacter stomatis]|uniref:hypothetical protein n=1 Tax=Peptoanaerobacter stomatis TaxID=796937 RepID=UPI003F9ED934